MQSFILNLPAAKQGKYLKPSPIKLTKTPVLPSFTHSCLPRLEKAGLVRGSGRCSFILRFQRTESGSFSSSLPPRQGEQICFRKSDLYFPLPSSVTSPVDYPGWSCRSLGIFRHLMNSFAVLSWYNSGTGKEGVLPLTQLVFLIYISLYWRSGSPSILRFNYFCVKFDWQMLKNFLCIGGLFQCDSPDIALKLHS